MKAKATAPSGPLRASPRIGILGGGQLARMLAQAAEPLSFEIHILSAHANDPAAQLQNVKWHEGSVERADHIASFFQHVDVVTFESEFVSPEILLEATAESRSASNGDIVFRPSLDALATLRNRESQKQALVDSKIATSPFIAPANSKELVEFFTQAKRGIVLKKKLFGYDGFGTFIIQERAALDAFIREHSVADFIAEERVIFRRELAVSLIRDSHGHIEFLPIVEWKARNNQCWWVKGPIASARIQKLKKDLKNIAKRLHYVGLLTFELFETSSGLLVNEVAPRVHNSAHHSIDSMATSQFTGHLIAVSGKSLKSSSSKRAFAVRKPFAMVNLVGSEKGKAAPPELKAPGSKATKAAKSEAAHLHWYGKAESRPGRKMGHLTVLAKTADSALKRALTLEKQFAKKSGAPT